MRTTSRISALCLLAALPLTAADQSWKDKPTQLWNSDDAKQVLADSPWAKSTTPEPLRDLSPNECLAGGDWKGCSGKGVGLAGTGLLGARREAEALERAHEKPRPEPVMVRWESALPIRAAERKAGETNVPAVDSAHYAIAVYHIQTPKRWNLARELRGIAFLRRYQKKDLKPSRVDILRQADGTANIVYLFPSSVEIGKRDGRIQFVAQIGRLFVSQFFYTDEMQLQGNLELAMPPDGKR